MSHARSRTNFVFRPKGDEQSLSFWSRARFAMLGANGVTEVTPHTHRELYGMLEDISDKAGMGVPKAYIWHSKKPMANAVAMPASAPTIAFSEKITELLNKEELAAVAGHELGHVKNMSHAGKLYWLAAFGGMAIGELVGRPLQRSIRRQMNAGSHNPLLGAADLAVSAGRFMSPLIGGAVASRSEEYAADRHGAYTMEGDAVPLLSGLQKLGEYNHQHTRPTMLGKVLAPFSKLISTHPELEQRRNALGVSREEIAGYRATHDHLPSMEKPAEQAAEPAHESPAQAGKWQSRIAEESARETTAHSR